MIQETDILPEVVEAGNLDASQLAYYFYFELNH